MRVFLVLYCVSASAQNSWAAAPWKHVTTTGDGIVVHARINKTTNEGQTLAKGLIDAPVEQIWKVLLDFDRYVTFMPYMKTSKVVKRRGEHVWQYCRTDTPVASDRDYTLQFTLKPGTSGRPWVMDWQVDNASGPKPVSGVVRVALATGGWILKPVQGGKATHFTYKLRTHPGGSIPLWLAHMGNKRAIPAIIRAVGKQVRILQ
jgi:hypothetical protein